MKWFVMVASAETLYSPINCGTYMWWHGLSIYTVNNIDKDDVTSVTMKLAVEQNLYRNNTKSIAGPTFHVLKLIAN